MNLTDGEGVRFTLVPVPEVPSLVQLEITDGRRSVPAGQDSPAAFADKFANALELRLPPAREDWPELDGHQLAAVAVFSNYTFMMPYAEGGVLTLVVYPKEFDAHSGDIFRLGAEERRLALAVLRGAADS